MATAVHRSDVLTYAGEIVQTEADNQEAEKKAAAAAEVERKAAVAAAAVAAARAKAVEDEKVKAYLEKKAAMDAAKASANQTLARILIPPLASLACRSSLRQLIHLTLRAQTAAPQVLEAVPIVIPDAEAKPSQPQKQMEL